MMGWFFAMCSIHYRKNFQHDRKFLAYLGLHNDQLIMYTSLDIIGWSMQPMFRVFEIPKNKNIHLFVCMLQLTFSSLNFCITTTTSNYLHKKFLFFAKPCWSGYRTTFHLLLNENSCSPHTLTITPGNLNVHNTFNQHYAGTINQQQVTLRFFLGSHWSCVHLILIVFTQLQFVPYPQRKQNATNLEHSIKDHLDYQTSKNNQENPNSSTCEGTKTDILNNCC